MSISTVVDVFVKSIYNLHLDFVVRNRRVPLLSCGPKLNHLFVPRVDNVADSLVLGFYITWRSWTPSS